jgi:hypothetical protein
MPRSPEFDAPLGCGPQRTTLDTPSEPEMTALFILLVLLIIGALAPRHGADSRGLTDEAWRRDQLWSRPS